MKKIAPVMLTVLLISSASWIAPFSSRAAELTASSRIAEVTVYQDRALVTRECEVALAQGPNTVLFENLPNALIEESLRAEGQGVSPVTISGVELKKIFGTEEADPRAAKITGELEKLQKDLQALELRRETFDKQKGFLDSVSSFSTTQISKDIMTKSPAPAEWSGISQYLLESYDANNSQTLALDESIKEKNKEIYAKQQELGQITSGRQIEKKTVMVNLDSKGPASFKLRLSYLVPQATWGISYDAKVYPDAKNCQLVSYGNIRQWTGEDWNDVKLTLSSVKPAVGGRMPELNPWYVDFAQVFVTQERYRQASYLRKEKAVKRKAVMASRALSLDAIGGPEEESAPVEKKADLAQAAVSQELGAATFEIAKPATIPSGNRFTKTPIKTESFAVKLDYETTPKISPNVFMHSKVTNDKDYPLMGGEINIFADDNYVGKSSTKTVGIGESFDLYLGVEEGVKVKRTELVDKKKGVLLGLRARKDYGYKFELENYKKDKISLTVIDQLPVSKNADIKVEMTASNPKPTETKDLGIAKWTFELAPKEKKILEFQFFVEYPSDKELSGV